jgi:hypothetical protein
MLRSVIASELSRRVDPRQLGCDRASRFCRKRARGEKSKLAFPKMIENQGLRMRAKNAFGENARVAGSVNKVKQGITRSVDIRIPTG